MHAGHLEWACLNYWMLKSGPTNLILMFEVTFVGNVKYVVGSKSFWLDQLFKVTEIKQLCYFST
jgi:hypothetical protein